MKIRRRAWLLMVPALLSVVSACTTAKEKNCEKIGRIVTEEARDYNALAAAQSKAPGDLAAHQKSAAAYLKRLRSTKQALGSMRPESEDLQKAITGYRSAVEQSISVWEIEAKGTEALEETRAKILAGDEETISKVVSLAGLPHAANAAMVRGRSAIGHACGFLDEGS